MKYFKYELWRKLNSENLNEAEKAEMEWDNNDKEYFRIFQRVKERLPKSFTKVYLENNGFHDFNICQMVTLQEFKKTKKNIQFKFRIFDEVKKYEIIYQDVSLIKLVYDSSEEGISLHAGLGTWGYDEFDIVESGILSHEILFDTGATLLLYFKKIKINRLVD